MFKDYESIKVGDSAKLIKKISHEEVKKFVEMTGDDNKLHIDKEYAKTTSFKDIVVHGMLGASFISTIIGTQLPGDGALWVSQTLDFLLPVRLGDELTISAKVLQKFERDRLLELETLVTNQNGQVVLSGRGKVRVLEPAPVKDEVKTEKLKVAIVTGGAGGIGQAISLSLSAAGYAVVVNYYKSEGAAAELVDSIQKAGGKASAIKANVSLPEEASELVLKTQRLYGTVSLIVNNASPKITPKNFEKLEWQDITQHLDVQLKGAFNLANACVPLMKAQKYGKIINITSQVLDALPTPGWTAYSLGKAALAHYSKCLALELGPFGINVNCVSPGMTETGFIGDIPEKSRLIIARQAPLRRLANPDDVSAAVTFLASENADFITGETLRVNGGQAML